MVLFFGETGIYLGLFLSDASVLVVSWMSQMFLKCFARLQRTFSYRDLDLHLGQHQVSKAGFGERKHEVAIFKPSQSKMVVILCHGRRWSIANRRVVDGSQPQSPT